MPNTLDFYNTNAATFYADTVGVDMSGLHARFLQCIPVGGLILDAGCGSGRDAKAFLLQGYRVAAFDASPDLARLATELLGQPVDTRSFDQVDETACYDGIWACASLLHLPESDLPEAIGRLWTALKSSGICYFSFKLGDGEREHNGRHFTDATEERVRGWIAKLKDVDSIDCWITQDQRPDRAENWLNALLHRRPERDAQIVNFQHPSWLMS